MGWLGWMGRLGWLGGAEEGAQPRGSGREAGRCGSDRWLLRLWLLRLWLLRQ